MKVKKLASPVTISNGGEVTRTMAHSGGATSDFSTDDGVSWQVTYDQDWLDGTGVEIIAYGTDQYLQGTAVDGERHDISGEIVVGTHVITDFHFISLRFHDGRLSGIAFLSEYFDVPLTLNGNPYEVDQYRILTPGAYYGYDSDLYDPVFQSPLDPVEWHMSSIAEGGLFMVSGILSIMEEVTISGAGEVTRTMAHSGGATSDFSVGDVVGWQITYNKYWLVGTGVEVIAKGTDRYLSGTAVDGTRRELRFEIVVGNEVITDFSFLSLQFQNGDLTGIAFLSKFFDVPLTLNGNPHGADQFRILTPGALYGYDSDLYEPVFQSTLDPVEWYMISQADGGEFKVFGNITV